MYNTIPLERLREVIRYDPCSGELTWLVAMGSRGKAGRRAGRINNQGYWIVNIDNIVLRAHRIAWALHYGKWPVSIIDHRDRDRLNNKITNLRAASKQENMANSIVRKDSINKIKGVTYAVHAKKWMARIHHDGKCRYLGYFDSKEEAGMAYMKEAAKIFGEFAHDGT